VGLSGGSGAWSSKPGGGARFPDGPLLVPTEGTAAHLLSALRGFESRGDHRRPPWRSGHLIRGPVRVRFPRLRPRNSWENRARLGVCGSKGCALRL